MGYITWVLMGVFFGAVWYLGLLFSGHSEALAPNEWRQWRLSHLFYGSVLVLLLLAAMLVFLPAPSLRAFGSGLGFIALVVLACWLASGFKERKRKKATRPKPMPPPDPAEPSAEAVSDVKALFDSLGLKEM